MAAPEDETQELITVGKAKDDNRAVWDVDPLHPSNYGQPAGEVFIADMRPYQVHNSRGIQQKIGEKALREISDTEASKRAKAAEDADKAREEQRQEMLKTQTSSSVTAVSVPPVLPDNSVIDDDDDDDDSVDPGDMAPPTSAPQQSAEGTEETGGRRLPRRNAGGKPPER